MAKRFKQAFQQQAERFPNYGKNHGIESKDWWRAVVKSTFLGAGVKKETLSPIIDDAFKNKSNVKLGVITNCDERVTEVMDSLGILQEFDFVITSSEFGEEKPAPKIFHHAVDIAKVSPLETLHVGDDYAKDYIAAKQAGLHALYIERNPVKFENMSANNHEMIKTLTEVLTWKLP
ncbi:Haloacid dehalogenase-like hydrolase domain-containing protein 3, partial [Basidiobolus ranarum]